MIFTGPIKQWIDTLLDSLLVSTQPPFASSKSLSVDQDNKQHMEQHVKIQQYNRIKKELFTETKHGILFLPFVLESIKQSHNTLSYILRQQYTNATQVYVSVIKVPVDARNVEEYCNSVWSRLASLDNEIIAPYFMDVTRYLIIPIFKKFGYFSPVMLVNLFIGLLLHLGEKYEHSHYGLIWKHHVRGKYKNPLVKQFASRCLQSTPLIDMWKDETVMWHVHP